MTTALLVFAAAGGGVVAGLHYGWKFHVAWQRWNKHAWCPQCGRVRFEKSPTLADPPLDVTGDT